MNFALALLLAAASTFTLPYYEWNYCSGEGCCFGEWEIRKDLPVYASPGSRERVTFTIKGGTVVTAITGVMITTRLGSAHLFEPLHMDNCKGKVIPAGETIRLVHYVGEGYELVEHGGTLCQAFLGTEQLGPYPTDAPVIRIDAKPEYEWWARLRRSDGRTGWAPMHGHFIQHCGPYWDPVTKTPR